MHPAVFEVNTHTIDGIHLIVSVFLSYLRQDFLQVDGTVQLSFLFHDAVIGIERTNLAATLLRLRHIGQEKRDAHERVTTVVQFGIDDASVAFAANHGIGLLHHLNNVDFAHSGRRVSLSVFVGYILQRTGGGKVRNRISGRMLQYVVGHSHEGVLLYKERAVLLNDSEAVHIGIHHETDIVVGATHRVADAGQILRDRLRIVCEHTVHLAIEHSHIINSQLFKQIRQCQCTRGVHRVENHLEVGLRDGVLINQRQIQDSIHMVFHCVLVERVTA